MTQKTNKDKDLVKLAVMATNIEHIMKEIGEIKGTLKNLKDDYVTRTEFEPIKKLVYGVAGLILTAVFVAGLAFLLA